MQRLEAGALDFQQRMERLERSCLAVGNMSADIAELKRQLLAFESQSLDIVNSHGRIPASISVRKQPGFVLDKATLAVNEKHGPNRHGNVAEVALLHPSASHQDELTLQDR